MPYAVSTPVANDAMMAHTKAIDVLTLTRKTSTESLNETCSVILASGVRKHQRLPRAA